MDSEKGKQLASGATEIPKARIEESSSKLLGSYEDEAVKAEHINSLHNNSSDESGDRVHLASVYIIDLC